MRSCFFLLLFTLILVPITAHAQLDLDAEEAWEEARYWYGEEDYTQARTYAIQAAQRAPGNPDYYLGIARILFFLEDYEGAVFYYDLYLNHFGPSLPDDIPRRNRPSEVADERESANLARENPSAAALMPEASSGPMAMLRERLDSGIIVTDNRSGAWWAYQTLLRSGYAHPELAILQERLVQALLDEAELFVNARMASMPALSYEQWQLQEQRFAHYLDLTEQIEAGLATHTPETEEDSDEEATAEAEASEGDGAAEESPGPTYARPVENVEAQLALCAGQLAYLNRSYTRAAEHFDTALVADPQMLPAFLGALNSRLRSGSVDLDTMMIIDRLEANASELDPNNIGVVDIYRALVEAALGNPEAGAARVVEMLGLELD